ncbi:MAG: ATP-NAD kinase-like domain-containing protein [Monoraphidium minutum]|nr:MAG: ATP-NAD kinase-like domain-containing protein [Monoraphidium minutum]
MSCYVILNPASGGGSGEVRWRKAEADVRKHCEAAGLEVEVLRTAAPNDATRLTAEALQQGAAVVVAAGGDGHINEVVSGFMQHRAAGGGAAPPAAARLAILPMGTGNDFVKTLGWKAGDAQAVALRIASGKTAPLDVGCLRVLSAEAAAALPAGGAGAGAGAAGEGEGGAGARWFCNVASCGVGAAAARRVQTLKRWPFAYDIAAVSALLAWAPPCPWEISVDGGAWAPLRDPTVLAVGNGKFWGGGFQICPGAGVGSGRVEATAVQGYGVWGFLTKGHLLRAGKFLGLPGVTTHAVTSQLTVRPAAAPGAGGWMPWEVDGEAAGEGAAVVSFVPGAIRLCV